MIGLPGHRTQGINHIRIVQISLNIHEEPVLPVSSRNRAGFNHLHIQMAERKVIQHVIESAALVGQLKADAHPIGLLPVNGLSGQNQKAGGIILTGINSLRQNFESIDLRCLGAGYSSLQYAGNHI